jgi:hypothetical protein
MKVPSDIPWDQHTSTVDSVRQMAEQSHHQHGPFQRDLLLLMHGSSVQQCEGLPHQTFRKKYIFKPLSWSIRHVPTFVQAIANEDKYSALTWFVSNGSKVEPVRFLWRLRDRLLSLVQCFDMAERPASERIFLMGQLRSSSISWCPMASKTYQKWWK